MTSCMGALPIKTNKHCLNDDNDNLYKINKYLQYDAFLTVACCGNYCMDIVLQHAWQLIKGIKMAKKMSKNWVQLIDGNGLRKWTEEKFFNW